MNKTITFRFIIFWCLTSITVFGAKTITGTQAEKLIPGAEYIRFEDNTELPAYVQFRKGREITYLNFENWFRGMFKTAPGIGFMLLNVEPDQMGMMHYRLQQTYLEFPVTNTMYIVHTLNGKVLSFNGTIYSKIKTAETAVTDEKTALSKALNYLKADLYRWQNPSQEEEVKRVTGNPDATWYPKGELVIAPVAGKFNAETLRLAYRFDIFAEKPFKRHFVFVDAVNGEIIYDQNRIMDINTPATAITVYSGTRNIITDSFGGGYRLRETGRGLGIETYNLQTSTNHGNAIDFTNTSTTWNNVNANLDQYATDAHWGAEKTYDFYDSLFARSSVDGAGQKLLSYVHYDEDLVNANWDGTHMNYGDGDASAGYTPLTAIDITGHEISHGVTQFTSNLVYQDEPGALNEGFSDCMGVAIRQFARNAPTIGWLIGDEIGGNPFRNMANPNQYGDPDTYGGTNWHPPGGSDNGGVHQNSGVLNFWFYLVTMGGNGTNDNGDAYSVSALGIHKACQILYRAQAIYLGPNSQFADARTFTIQAAIDLYGACTNEVIQVTNAWYAVGVGNPFAIGVNAAFSTPVTSFCSVPDSVQFINASTNAGTFFWDFGDGNFSTQVNPIHVYTTYGVYNVKLVADGGSCGTDSVIQNALININASNPCVTTIGTTTVQTSCTGTVYDNGGPLSNYSDNTNYTITIAPANAASVNLHFNSFSMESNYDYLRVYDGPNTASPLIGTFSGNNIPADIQSSGGAITLRQTSDVGLTYSGFNISWTCTPVTAPPVVDFSASNTTTCNGTVSFYDLTTGGATSWLWRFGDGTTSVQQNPTHTYSASGNYHVTLVVSNIIGTDSLVQSNYISVNLPASPVAVPATVNCGTTASLLASGNSQLQWFDAPSGGNMLDTGSTFQTPVLNADVTYYVQSTVEAPSNYLLPAGNSIGNGNNYTNNTYRGQVFDCLTPLRLVSVKVYASGAGNRTIQLRDNTGAVVFNTVANIPDGTSRVYLNYDIQPGVDYELGCIAPANLYRNSTGAVYPYTYPGMLSITGNTASANGYYYFFYDWEIKGPSCISARTSVTVDVAEPIAQFTEAIAGPDVTFTNYSSGATTYLWNFGDNSTSTLTNPVHTYLVDGTYPVTLYAYSGNCVDSTMRFVTIVTTRLNENTLNSFNIIPNPGNGHFTLQSPVEAVFSLEVISLTGQKVLVVNSTATHFIQFDLSTQPRGIYFVKCYSSNAIRVQRIVLE